jgi:sphinganine-1-phosphate aldolase
MKGITSISADFHKYALSEKGVSIVMYNSVKYIESQYFVYSDWCGGIYATNTLLGSRPGSIIAITWAGMLARGFDYYRKSSLEIVSATRYIAEKLEEIPEVTVIGDPKMLINVVAFNTPLFDIYSINSELKSRGWNLNPLQFPSSLHICITNANSSGDKAKEFIKDVKWAVNKCRDEFNGVAPEDGGSIYGTSQKITNRSLVSSVAKIYLNTLYFP